MFSYSKIHMTQKLAEVMLIIAMLLWGTTFVIVKETIEVMPVHWFHFLRFTMGALAIWVPFFLFGGGAKHLSWGSITSGSVLGVLLFLLFATQTTGLLTTTASKSAFITATAVLWVPALTVLVLRKRMDRIAVTAGCTGLVGIFLLLMDKGLASFHPDRLVPGDFWTMACALSVAVHLLLTKRLSPRYDTWALTGVQLTVVALLSLICSVIFGETRSFSIEVRHWGGIVYLGVITTALNMWILTYVQRYTTPQRTAVIFLVEPLFASITAWIFLHEMLGPVQWVGALLILVGMVAIECVPQRETKLDAEAVVS